MSEPAPDRAELGSLRALARQELADSFVEGLSADGSFAFAYGAALTTATMVLRSLGERVHGPDHHRVTFARLARVAGGRWMESADYFQHCRRRRNAAMYEQPGAVSRGNVTLEVFLLNQRDGIETDSIKIPLSVR
ncbi:MAG: hypothetical protein AUH85_06050 [Chloroflexi bacterium 13_1_40CM_4_68_4]|nr:MAG: hypothetical protein AUH85_06050 [Chloroflexi bacterium 13_1_40CM_4_68_4]